MMAFGLLHGVVADRPQSETGQDLDCKWKYPRPSDAVRCAGKDDGRCVGPGKLYYGAYGWYLTKYLDFGEDVICEDDAFHCYEDYYKECYISRSYCTAIVVSGFPSPVAEYNGMYQWSQNQYFKLSESKKKIYRFQLEETGQYWRGYGAGRSERGSTIRNVRYQDGSWKYDGGANNQWTTVSGVTVECPGGATVNAAISSQESIVSESNSDDVAAMMIGAGIGVMAIVLFTVFLMVLLKRRNSAKVDVPKVTVTELAAQHVPDASSVSTTGASSV